jgi:hypothetical protein
MRSVLVIVLGCENSNISLEKIWPDYIIVYCRVSECCGLARLNPRGKVVILLQEKVVICDYGM